MYKEDIFLHWEKSTDYIHVQGWMQCRFRNLDVKIKLSHFTTTYIGPRIDLKPMNCDILSNPMLAIPAADLRSKGLYVIGLT